MGHRGPKERPLPSAELLLPSGRTLAEAVARATGPRDPDDELLREQDLRLIEALAGYPRRHNRRRQMSWIGLGFVATAANASPDQIKALGPISIVAPQISFGLGYPENDPSGANTRALLSGCRGIGLDVAGWGWCDNASQAEQEGRYHAGEALELGLGKFIANMEEPYDAHGNSSDPRMWAPDTYAQAFKSVAPAVELAVTTTPRWASSGNGLRAVGATVMPQAFTCEVKDATIPNCVTHAQAWGWTTDKIRPLVQVYMTNGQRPDPGTYNADAASYNVGVVPYILEQAMDGDGQQMIKTLSPSITRPPAS